MNYDAVNLFFVCAFVLLHWSVHGVMRLDLKRFVIHLRCTSLHSSARLVRLLQEAWQLTHMTSHQVKPLQVRFALADFVPLRAGQYV